MSRCTKAIIYKKNLEHNIKQIRHFVNSDTQLCIAVKADSYGHNAILTSKIAEENGVNFLAVATVEEGIELRDAGIKANILLLSLCTPEDFYALFEYSITPLVFTNEYITLLSNAADSYFTNNEKFNVHLAVDTGMGRIGCYEEEAVDQAKLISNSKHLTLAGMITHLCVADSIEEENQKFTKEQGKIFQNAVNAVKNAGINPGICSCGASAALMNNTDMHFDMVRPGIITYGYYPDEVTEDYLKQKGINLELKPVLAFKTKVVAIRDFPKGKTISYGRTYKCDKNTKIAVLPVGYADGLLRRFSPGLEVTINGKNYPIRGRICMDQCMVEIGENNSDVKLWDDVWIFGPKECGALNTADDLAKIGNTISYEVLTSLSKRIKREIH